VITNLGTLEVAGAASLLNDTLTNTGHTVQVDSAGVLTLEGTTVIDGTVTNTGETDLAGFGGAEGAAR